MQQVRHIRGPFGSRMEGRKTATAKIRGAKKLAAARRRKVVVKRVKNKRADTKKPRIKSLELCPNKRGVGAFIRLRIQAAGATTSVAAHNQA
jgi:hypothetical protein